MRARHALPPVDLVSIRAPARGAILSNQQDDRDAKVSIRAPARGAIRLALALRDILLAVSIRAPARGAIIFLPSLERTRL
jgi:hypothetical protein